MQHLNAFHNHLYKLLAYMHLTIETPCTGGLFVSNSVSLRAHFQCYELYNMHIYIWDSFRENDTSHI